MKVVTEHNVTCCSNCPHFFNGPHEMTCDLYEKKHGAYSSTKFLHRPHSPVNGNHIQNSIPKECPLK